MHINAIVNDLPLHSAPSHLQEWYQGKQTQCRHHNCLGPWRPHPKLTHPSLGPWWTGERKGRPWNPPRGKSVAFGAENREKPSKSVFFYDFYGVSVNFPSHQFGHVPNSWSMTSQSTILNRICPFFSEKPIYIYIYIYPIDTRYIFNIYIYTRWSTSQRFPSGSQWVNLKRRLDQRHHGNPA